MYSDKSIAAAKELLKLDKDAITCLANYLRRYQDDKITYSNEDFDRLQHIAALIHHNAKDS